MLRSRTNGGSDRYGIRVPFRGFPVRDLGDLGIDARLAGQSPRARIRRIVSLTPALRRAVAGSLGAGLAIQCCLIASGIAVARMLGAQHRGQFALMTLFRRC